MSSHIRTGDLLVRDLWPKSLPKLGSHHLSMHEITPRYVLPSALDQTLFWVDVEVNPEESDKARTTYVIYHALPGPNGDGGDTEIQIHMQGFVVACNVHPLGTWKAHQGAETAPNAYQYLEVSGLDAPDAFSHQVRGLHALTRTIEMATRLQCANLIKEGANTIRLWRKTFTKARPGKPAVSVLKRGDDITGQAKKMEALWFLDHRIDILMQTEGGKLAPLHHGLLGKGDFVDVLVKVSVHRNVPYSRRTIRVDFAMQKIVLLKKHKTNDVKVVPQVVEADKMDIEAVQKLALDIAASMNTQ